MTKFYLLYSLFLIALIAAIAHYKNGLVEHYRPTRQTFENQMAIHGTLGDTSGRKGASVPRMNGYPFACGVSYLGATQLCGELLPSMKVGTPFAASAALVSTKSGPVLVALSIVLQDGTRYSATPELMVEKWDKSSHPSNREIPFIVLIMFVGLPLLVAWLVRLTNNPAFSSIFRS